ncbi:MAG: pyrroline-5-carboxylate reductase [Sedimentisphaerales bacterium]|nr:pyrroline-5-carboxylate reductase [Sedimentisphaerales bacterium]
MQIGFLGLGKMAEALIGGMVRAGRVQPQDIIGYDPDVTRGQKLQKEPGIRISSNALEVWEQAEEMVFLAFKPQNFEQAVKSLLAQSENDKLIVSILAGVRIERIRQALPGAKVVRVMPNTPCLVGRMACGFATSDDVSPVQRQAVRQLLEACGIALEVSEPALDAVTGLSGSGPAFIAYLIEAFIAGGIAAGLDEVVARQLTLETFIGTAELLKAWNLTGSDLIEMVSSPNGTTVAGRAILEASDVRQIIIDTIVRAAQRGCELGQ